MQWVDRLRKAEQQGRDAARHGWDKAMHHWDEAESKLRQRMRVHPSSCPDTAASGNVPAPEADQTKPNASTVNASTAPSPEASKAEPDKPIVSIHGKDVDEKDVDETAA